MKNWLVLIIVLGVLLGCNLPTAVTPTPFPTATAVPLQTSTPTLAPPPTDTAVPIPILIPTATNTSLPPTAKIVETAVPDTTLFTNLRFAASPNNPPQEAFPVGTAEVFALWDFAGMVNGDRVQRVWRRDGVNWLNRDEAWTAGPSGVVTDVSVYDRGLGGLEPGNYELELYVNGVLEAYGQFVILSRPATGEPVIANLRFAETPFGAPQSSFPVWTQQIFAVWDYRNMGVSDVVRREWLKDGQPWLVREETWDYLHYGPQGVVSDVSIYDFETGLPPGVYELLLSLNGIQQLAGTFTITP
ncbi:MAG: hypothetical protein H6661_01140 [Ardenticatenaceae bacterium]|nr:hypothetical protein [Ardenticatenaceae bacterium]